MKQDTNWREDLTEAMKQHGETWADVEAHTLTEEELDKRFDHGYGGEEGVPFTLWTKNRVYFPGCYDGAEWVASVARNPDGKATAHVGGGQSSSAEVSDRRAHGNENTTGANGGSPTDCQILMEIKRYTVGDTLRMKHYPTAGGFRVWKVVGVHLGATHQEGTYALKPLDVSENEPIHVPCLMLETHGDVERV